MSLYWYDSFQNYSSLATIWDSFVWCSIASGNRNGGTCFNKSGFNVPQEVLKRIGSNHTDSTLGIAINYYGGIVGTGVWDQTLSFYDSQFSGTWTDTLQIQLQVGNNGNVRVVQGASTVLATSTSAPLLASGWHYVEFYSLIDNSAGAFTVWVDGVQILNGTGVKTQSSSNAYLNSFMLGGNNSTQWNGCDLYLLDSSGSAPLNAHLGDVRVLYSQPLADGGTNQFTSPAATVVRGTLYHVGDFIIDPNGNTQRCTTQGITAGSAPTYNTSSTTTDGTAVFTFWSTGSGHVNLIKEAAPDDLTSFLADSTVGDKELYTINALSGVPTGVTSVLAVGIDVRAEKDQTSNRAIRTVVNTSGNESDNGADLALVNGSWSSFKSVFPTNPTGGVSWNVTAVNGAKIGFKVAS